MEYRASMRRCWISPAIMGSCHGSAIRIGRRPKARSNRRSAISSQASGQDLNFDSLEEVNRQALVWCGEANRRIHATTREVPLERFPREGLTPLNGQPDYDTSYESRRQAAKDCLVSYRGNRYSVPTPMQARA